MTTLNFALSRVAGRDLREGDEILVSALDHDGGVAPWVELAADRGLVVRTVAARDDFTYDVDDLERQLSERTRIVAFAWASNAVGTVADAARICALAREAGALSWIDAVHYAAHEPIDARELGCDVLLCSPYKFCGPHLGVAHVRRELAETLAPVQGASVRDEPGRTALRDRDAALRAARRRSRATLAYLESIGGMEPIRTYERELGERFLAGLGERVRLVGPATMDDRVPTFLLTVDGVDAKDAAERLAERGLGVWHADNWYCLGLVDRLPPRSLRVGFIHYNTPDEVDRLLAELAALAA